MKSSLKFAPEIEADFLEYYFENTILHTRPAIVLGFCFYSLFYILDLFFVPEVAHIFVWIRFGFVGPMILLSLYFSYQSIFTKYNQIFIASSIFFAGEGIVWMTLIRPDYTFNYYAGIILVLIYCYTLLGLRIYWSSLMGGIVVLSYILCMQLFTELPLLNLISNYFFLFGANLLLMFAGYFTEVLKRKDFYSQYQLGEIKKELEDVNSDLEARISARTSELSDEIIQRIGAQEKIQKAHDEKEVLLKEVYHRTKNNMNVVISLLNMQSRDKKQRPVEDVFKRISDRIYSMSLVHEQLYRSDDLSQIVLGDYLQKLVLRLKHSLIRTRNQIQFEFDLQVVSMSLEKAVPLGLALNEIITNTIIHGYKDGREGQIILSLRREDEKYIQIEIANDGYDYPADMILDNPTTLGMKLIQMLLVDQLEGEIKISNSPHPIFRIKLLV